MIPRVGFLGAGFISRTHRWFLEHASLEHRIVAVHDPDHQRARALADRVGARAVEADELWDLVDAVVITAWTSEHDRLVGAAAERGIAVFCEKPLAMDARVVESMVETVERAGVENQVGLVLRFLPQFIHARSLIADERAGQLMAVTFRDDQFIPIQGHYGSTWRVDPARCGRGTLLEHSIHDVDILRWLCGPIEAVSGSVREVHGHDRIDDLAVARLEFESGGVASLTSIWHDMVARPSQRRVEVFCQNLYISLDGTPTGPLEWQFADGELRSLRGCALAQACLDGGVGRTSDLVTWPGGVMFNPMTEFLRAVRDSSESSVPFREAVPLIGWSTRSTRRPIAAVTWSVTPSRPDPCCRRSNRCAVIAAGR